MDSLDRIWRRDNDRLLVEQFKNALTGRHRRLEDVVLLAQILNGPEEALGVLDEADEHTNRDGTKEAGSATGIDCVMEKGDVAQHSGTAKPEDQGDRCGA